MTGSTRRRFLARSGLAVATAGVLGGCLGDDSGESSRETADDTSLTETGGGDTTSETLETESPTGRPTTTDLDLREANVTGVAVDARGSGVDGTDYRFDVTLYHDDDGEDGYANWWQVETRSGRRLGRRDLSHAHGTREFTRSATVTVPDGVDTVVVRSHDQTHGYGGRAALATLADGTVAVREQGPDPDDFGVGTAEGTAAVAPRHYGSDRDGDAHAP
ncbi:twin-arginine translocation signal domain-containing protein [Halobaculum sp. MBLA0147]|uniref:twin-arginine translocation signal domain-containing protein n=1 Tax=Halobaculum sp. MBLA0147 TaxID=3079934 RepID=UPI0035237B90